MSIFKDGLMGLAVGEAFGVQLDNEDMNLKSPVTEMESFRAYDVEGGAYSDDTVSNLAIMDSFSHKRVFDMNDVCDRLCDWINENTYSSVGTLFDISKTLRLSLMDYWNTHDASINGRMEDSKQDASVLTRIYPLAIYSANKKVSEETLLTLVKEFSLISHNNEMAFLGAFIYLKYILYLLNGSDKKSALASVKRYNYKKYFSENAISKFDRILKGNIKNLKVKDIKDDDGVVSILESSLWVVLNTDNFKDALVSSSAIGGANGVRGSVTGLLAGIINSKKSIPKEWINTLKRKDYIEKILRIYVSVI